MRGRVRSRDKDRAFLLLVLHVTKPLKVNIDVAEEPQAGEAAACSKRQEKLHQPRPPDRHKQ